MVRVFNFTNPNWLQQEVTRAQKAGLNLDKLDEFLLFAMRAAPPDLLTAMIEYRGADSTDQKIDALSFWRKTAAKRRARPAHHGAKRQPNKSHRAASQDDPT
jgi:hypothetical protein